MDTIQKIYSNTFGISFYWKDRNDGKIQIIFRDTGFYLDIDDVESFQYFIQFAKEQENCITCKAGKFCKSILLRTPSEKINMAVSLDELEKIEELFSATMFHLKLDTYLSDLCKN